LFLCYKIYSALFEHL